MRRWLILLALATQVFAAPYPPAINAAKVGTYPALTKSGAGYMYDEVLEYRVWLESGDGDEYRAFSTFEEALAFSKHTANAEHPLVLVRQLQHINEPKPGVRVLVKEPRITEWRVEWLVGNKRTPQLIRRLLKKR